MKARPLLLPLFILLCVVYFSSCSDDDSPSNSNQNGNQPDIDTILATDQTAIAVTVADGQRVQITVTDSVNSNPDGPVLDCDLWTNADGIPDCQYVTSETECRNLPFMALIGYMHDEYFLIGVDFDSTFASGGELEIMINDWVFYDNYGRYIVSILIE